MRRLVALCALSLLAAPATAAAGVHVTTPSAGTLRIADATAASSDLDLTRYGGDVVEIRDFPVTEDSADCSQVDATHVRCTVTGYSKAEIFLGPADDSLDGSAGALRVEVHGEGGDDELNDGDGDDLLDGGTGDDQLYISEGSDEALGGADSDFVRFENASPDLQAVLPDTGTSTDNGNPGEDDVLHADVEGLHAETGDVTGNDQPNSLSGHDVDGRGGGDDITAHGGVIQGGDGDDFLRAADDFPDESLACGKGADRLDADNDVDPTPSGCETIAPEFPVDPFVDAGPTRVGDTAYLSMPPLTGTAPTSVQVEWLRCDDSFCLFADADGGPEYTLVADDHAQFVYARVTVGNSAGGDQADSNAIGPVRSAPEAVPPPPGDFVFPPGFVPPPPPPGYFDYGDYADYADYADRIQQLEDSIAAWARGLLNQIRSVDPRRYARPLRRPFRFRETGTLNVTLTTPAHGPGARAAKGAVVLARGKRRGAKGQRRTIVIRPTKAGKRILRRAKRLKVRMTATFVGGPATASSPATVRRNLVLKRKRS
ncbi:MAG TPA: hypothetical protein VF587_20685 [Solirubrobacteraceae bacterium]|jgi:Ca2+-binding RTX toxin-like protein